MSTTPYPPKVDPKIQTPQNVSQLKSALAAALAKGKPVEAKPAVAQAVPIVNKTVSIETSQNPVQQGPREVPEDILKKVLKID